MEVDGEQKKFNLPLSIWQRIRFIFLTQFFLNNPFSGELFLDSKNNSFYWQVILNYLKLKLGAIQDFYPILIDNRFLGYESVIRKDPRYKKKQGVELTDSVVSQAHDVDREVTLSKSVGEYLERYFLATPSESEKAKIKRFTFSDLKEISHLYSKYHQFNSEQKRNNKYLNIKEDTLIDCLNVIDLVTHKEYPYPMQSIFWMNGGYRSKEGLVASISTSGSAGGFSKEGAIISAIFENVERDSFLCYWHSISSPNIITIDENDVLGIEYYKLKAILADTPLKVFLLDTVTEFGIPSVICAVKHDQDGTFCVSGGSGHDYITAINKAVLEMYSCISRFNIPKDRIKKLDADYMPQLTKGIDRSFRLDLWMNRDISQNANFFFSGNKISLSEVSKIQPFAQCDLKNEKLYLLRIIEKFKNVGAGFDKIYLYEIKNEILSKLGFYVVRVIMPKLLIMTLFENEIFTHSERLTEFYNWKHKGKKLKFNPFPHPFP